MEKESSTCAMTRKIIRKQKDSMKMKWKKDPMIDDKKGKRKLGAQAMKRVAAGAQSPDSYAFWAWKRPDDGDDYSLDCSFLPQGKHQVLVFTLEWSGTHPNGWTVTRARPIEHSQRSGPPSSGDQETPVDSIEFRIRELSISNTMLCRCATELQIHDYSPLLWIIAVDESH